MKRQSQISLVAILFIVLANAASAQQPPVPAPPPTPAAEATPAATCAVGTKIQVFWNSSWYDATILAGPNAEGQCQIHYDGWDSSWDEWVGAERMRAVSGFCTPGNPIQVLWEGTWYDATVLSGAEEACMIHYDGWDASWDEVVGPGRMRSRSAEQ